MYLKELRLANFKNCESAELTFSEKLNCFVGLNGAGKTNILDSIYYLSFCKSYFNAVDKLNIRHDQDFFSIHGTYGFDGKENEMVSCVQKRDAKKSFKFIDGVISQFDPLYLNALLKYNRALLQRNMQLRQFADTRHFDSALLQLWDDQLCVCATDIHEKRHGFLREFRPIFQHYYEVVSGAKERVEVDYCSKLDQKPMEQLLKESLQQDSYSCYTNVGIHKDDLEFCLDGHPLKKFGSQGQQKSFVVSIRLAQFEYNYQKIGYKPILLLDDIFDKLDDQRVMKLVRLVGDNHFGQVFITDTQRQRIERLFEDTDISHKIFEVESGHVNLVSHE